MSKKPKKEKRKKKNQRTLSDLILVGKFRWCRRADVFRSRVVTLGKSRHVIGKLQLATSGSPFSPLAIARQNRLAFQPFAGSAACERVAGSALFF
jgi:hypothetical protein